MGPGRRPDSKASNGGSAPESPAPPAWYAAPHHRLVKALHLRHARQCKAGTPAPASACGASPGLFLHIHTPCGSSFPVIWGCPCFLNIRAPPGICLKFQLPATDTTRPSSLDLSRISRYTEIKNSIFEIRRQTYAAAEIPNADGADVLHFALPSRALPRASTSLTASRREAAGGSRWAPAPCITCWSSSLAEGMIEDLSPGGAPQALLRLTAKGRTMLEEEYRRLLVQARDV